MFQDSGLSGRTRGVLLVTFFTLTLTAFAFLFAIYSLDHNNKEVFSSVHQNIERSINSTSLYRILVQFELEVRDLVSIILREPYRLNEAKSSLQEQFELILAKAESNRGDPEQQKLLKQLRLYRSNLNGLLGDYGTLNKILYEVYISLNSIKEQLIYLEETAKALMKESSATEGTSDPIQQAYVQISLVYEKMLQIHILINSSITNYDPKLLIAGEEDTRVRDEETVLGKIRMMEDTLLALSAAESETSTYAKSVQEKTQQLKENIFDLAVNLENLNDHYRLFVNERDNTLQLLEDMEVRNHSSLLETSSVLKGYSQKTRLVAWLIAIAVLFISIVGLLLVKKMSQKLEISNKESRLAREAAEHLNKQLQLEVEERKKIADDLVRARDELEERVRDRTAELSNANRGLALEIEERKNAEHALAQEKEQLSVTLRSIGDGVITTGLDGKVVLLNKVAEDMTGWKQDEAFGKAIEEVFYTINQDTGQPCDNLVAQMLKDGSVYYNLEEEKVLVNKNGAEYYISDNCAPIKDEDSNAIGAVLVFRDISDKRKMQDEVLKSEKLKSVGILAGGIAHDFNNILAAIVGKISLAKLQLEGKKNVQAFQFLDDAEKASLRARNLTQQLLTFSKGGEPVRKVESIGDIISESASFILSGGKIHCDYSISADLWPVSIDAGQMSQVVQNIIINSMHAMPLGGMIKISCSNFDNTSGENSLLPAEKFVRVSIKDEGPGIPEEFQDKIFDPYFTTKEEGSGLGLALTHSIVTKHQGYIDLKSGDWGTEFIIYLPALPDSVLKKGKDKDKVKRRFKKANILVMDDEEMIRDIAGDILTHLGFDVATVRDGEQAVKLYRERLNSDNPFDVVIMDLTIPGGMGGKDAIQKLLDIDPHVKAIVSSGYSNDPVMAEHERYGFAGIVHKPFDVEELLEALYEVIGTENGV